jgi:hypothetical protein
MRLLACSIFLIACAAKPQPPTGPVANDSNTASPTALVLDETHASAYSAREQRVAYLLSVAEEGTDVYGRLSIVGLDNRAVEDADLGSRVYGDEGKTREAATKLARRGYVAMSSVAWPDEKTETTAAGHTFRWSKSAGKATIFADGKELVSFDVVAPHEPRPVSISYLAGERVVLVVVEQNPGEKYAEGYNVFTEGRVGQLAAPAK